MFVQISIINTYPPFIIIFFLTSTGLANHSGWKTSLMKPATSSLASSFLVASLLSGANMHSLYFFGIALGSTFRQCSISSLGTLGISVGCHAKMSQLALWKLTSALSYLGSSPPPITAVLLELPSWSWTVFVLTSLVGLIFVWPDLWLGISISDWESCWTATSTSPEVFGTRVVEAYSMASWSQSYDFLGRLWRSARP